jgi:hypothetical protein
VIPALSFAPGWIDAMPRSLWRRWRGVTINGSIVRHVDRVCAPQVM